MKLFKKMRKGFTLIELVVVIAVIAILSAVAVVSYVTITNKAKQSNDQQKVDQLNLSLTAVEIGGKPSTMYKALDGLREEGFIPENFKAEARNYKFAYSMSKNRFVILDNNKVVYPKNISDLETWDIWKFASNEEELDSGYSHYLLKDFASDGSISVNAGVDVGENAGLKSITYSNDANKKVVIRTNSVETALTIDDASTGSVYHYGSAGALNIIKCHTSSYHENGKVAFAEIAKGRIVLESGSEVTHIHVNKKTNEESFDTVILENNGAKSLPEAITRDEVSLTSGSVDVVTVQSGSTEEVVKVYASGQTGSTQQTETQNTNVNSPLGQLVLDNGSNAGEKAMSPTEKEDTKTEIVNEALDLERKDQFDANNYWIGVAAANFAGGNGTESSPYQIGNAEQLSRLAFVMYSHDYAQYQDCYYELTANIDLSAKCWVPIVTSARGKDTNRYFRGSFNGKGYTISGLNNLGLSMSFISTMANDSTPLDGAEYVYGLFGDIFGATIKNVNLANINIVGGIGASEENGTRYISDSVGALVGYATGNITIDNCKALSGSVEGYDGVSGIIGKAHDSSGASTDSYTMKITNCSNAATINAVRRAAGIVGNVRGSEITDLSSYTKGMLLTGNTNSGAITSKFVDDYSAKDYETSNYYAVAGIAVLNRNWSKTNTDNALDYGNSQSFNSCSNTGVITNNANSKFIYQIAGGQN